MNTLNIKTIQFPHFVDTRGSLCFGEFPKHIPFEVKRFFLIYHTPENSVRGEHAHKACKQVHICVHGSVEFTIDTGFTQEKVVLNKPNEGLIMGPFMWHTLTLSKDACILVLCSETYDESDYIRDYTEFIKLVQEKN